MMPLCDVDLSPVIGDRHSDIEQDGIVVPHALDDNRHRATSYDSGSSLRSGRETCSESGDSAIHADGLAGQSCCGRSAQEDDQRGEVFRYGHTQVGLGGGLLEQ